MENIGIWVVGFIILFIFGLIFGFCVSLREKVLGEMCDKVCKMGLYLCLVVVFDWMKILMVLENCVSMVVYYSVLILEVCLFLMCVCVVDQQFEFIIGDDKFKYLFIELKGIYVIDM